MTLYTVTGACEPCAQARQFLKQRGVPFSERQGGSTEDIDALEKISGGRDAPTLTVGSQVLRGFASRLLGLVPRRRRLPARIAPAGELPVPARGADRRRARPRAPRPARTGAAGRRRAAPAPAAPAPAASASSRDARARRARRAATRDAPTWRAATLPPATAAPIIQNSADAPSVAPATPNASGITALDRLIAIERSAIASPCRAAGVIWCSVVMIIGWTAPSARPRTTAQQPITQAVRASG